MHAVYFTTASIYVCTVIDHTEDAGSTISPMGTCRPQLPIPTSSKKQASTSARDYPLTSSANNLNTSATCQSAAVSTVIVTATVEVTASVPSCQTTQMVQQSEVSADNNESCNALYIAVPAASVFIALIVLIFINVMVVKTIIWKRSKGGNDMSTAPHNHTDYVVENDLYQLASSCVSYIAS